MKNRTNHHWLRWIRVAISLSLLLWLVMQIDAPQLLALSRMVIWPLVVLAFVLQFVGVWISATKWWLVLRASHQRVPYLWAVQTYFIGQFFSNFLPTMIGGDAVRIYQLSRRIERPALAVASVFVERLTGFFALTVIAATSLTFSIGFLDNNPAVLWSAIGCLIIAACAVVTAACLPLIARFISRLPVPNIADWRGKLTSMNAALRIAYMDKRALAIVILISFGYQLSWIAVNYAIIRALDLSVSFAFTAVIVPISDIVGLVPLFLNSIGSRSGTFVVLLAPLGITAASVVALSALVFFVRLLASCIGGVLYVVGGMQGTHQPLQRDTAKPQSLVEHR